MGDAILAFLDCTTGCAIVQRTHIIRDPFPICVVTLSFFSSWFFLFYFMLRGRRSGDGNGGSGVREVMNCSGGLRESRGVKVQANYSNGKYDVDEIR